MDHKLENVSYNHHIRQSIEDGLRKDAYREHLNNTCNTLWPLSYHDNLVSMEANNRWERYKNRINEHSSIHVLIVNYFYDR